MNNMTKFIMSIVIVLIIVSVNVAIFWLFPFSVLFFGLSLVGSNVQLNILLSVICVTVAYSTNKKLINDLYLNFNWHLMYVMSGGLITVIYPSKEDFIKKIESLREKKDE